MCGTYKRSEWGHENNVLLTISVESYIQFYNFVELTIKCYKLLLAKMAVYDLSALLRYGRPEFESRLMIQNK